MEPSKMNRLHMAVLGLLGTTLAVAFSLKCSSDAWRDQSACKWWQSFHMATTVDTVRYSDEVGTGPLRETSHESFSRDSIMTEILEDSKFSVGHTNSKLDQEDHRLESTRDETSFSSTTRKLIVGLQDADTLAPSDTPSADTNTTSEPTQSPSVVQTNAPTTTTLATTGTPSSGGTATPTSSPVGATAEPSLGPTSLATGSPTFLIPKLPNNPSPPVIPGTPSPTTEAPIGTPSYFPTIRPTDNPTSSPSSSPRPSTMAPTSSPSNSMTPTANPTGAPTATPSTSPRPTTSPTRSLEPTLKPTTASPTISNKPSSSPSSSPTAPTEAPTQVTFVPGLLTVSENRLLLSEGLTSRILAESGERVRYANGDRSGDSCHFLPDFGATYRDPRPDNVGGWIYVSNSEDRDNGQGGVGSFTFNKDGEIIDYRIILDRTTANCGGGATPWGAWISCEETEGGNAWQVDPTGERRPGIITLGSDGGEFESFAYDLHSKDAPQFFLTEDTDDGPLQRWVPDDPNWDDPWNILYGKGTTTYLLLDISTYPNTFRWTSDKREAAENAARRYPNAEGIDCVGSTVYFVSKEKKRMYVLDLNTGTFTSRSTRSGAFDGGPDQVVKVIGRSNLLFFTEDGGDRPGIHARDSAGRFYTILEGIEDDESTGLALSPDSKSIYFAMQKAGLIYEVKRTDGLPFDAKTLNIKYHAKEPGII